MRLKPKKQKIANRFFTRYGPDFLQQVGPYIGASWHVHPLLEAELVRQNRRVPDPVNGQLILDTGAERTCISAVAAHQLGLKPIRRISCFGAGGLHETDIVLARLLIAITDHRGITTAIWWDMETQTVKDLEKHPQMRGVKVNGEPANLIGLLGRDILRNATVIYNGHEGKMEVTFNRQWIKRMEADRQPLEP